MGSSQKDLSDWERLTKPRVYSRSQHTTTKSDIHSWLKNVEDSSSCASGSTTSVLDPSTFSAYSGLGSSKYSTGAHDRFSTAGYNSNAFQTGGFGSVKAATKKKIESAVSEARIQESAYIEAQELINQWVKEKVHEDAGLDEDFESDVASQTRADVKRQWDHLTKPDSDEDDLLKPATNPDDIYRILEEDETKIVKGLMGRMMEKPIFSSKFTSDLGMDDNPKPTVDPRVKMEMRHKMVKENREKRAQEKKKKLEEKRMRKEMDFQARQIVQLEEKEKVARQRQEEQEVQKQMAVIRKQMEEERKALEEQRQREKRQKDAIAEKARQEMEKQREEERKYERKAQLLAEQRQRNIQLKMAEIQTRQAAENLKSLQRHFSAWYGVVVTRRVQLGKARATADWKCMLRAWNAWRACVRDRTLDQQTRQHEHDVREMHRKEAQAKQHHRLRLLRKYFLSWQIYTQSQLTAKEVDQSKTRTKSKMAAFLQAATTGKIGGQRDEMEEEDEDSDEEDGSKVEALFLAEVRQHQGAPSSSRSSQYTTRSEYLARTKKALQKPPTQAWQVTKKHARLSKRELAALKQTPATENPGPDQTARTDQSETLPKEKTWQKAPYVVDSYANRHLAQQKILEQQQKQIKEQQRLIEELTYLQKQQMLQQQALQSQTQQLAHFQNGTGGTTGGVVTGGGDASKLQQHIDNLQKELVAKNQDLDELQKEIERNEQETSRSDLTQMSSNRSKLSSVSSKMSTISKTTTDSKHLSFLKSMEERANERARIKKEREEKKRKEEEEKRAALLEEEERLLKEQEEEKRKKAEAYREKKRLEKEKELEKQQFAEKMKDMMKAAHEHHELSVVKYRGWLPWLRLVEMAREQKQRAESHYKMTLLRKCLLSWHNSVEKEVKEKKAVADHFYQYLLVRRSFHNWKKYGQAMLIMDQKADRHYLRNLQTKVLVKWMDFASSEKVGMWHKERKAKEHNIRRMQLTCLRAWRRFPRLRIEEEEREKRRAEMRNKVAALLSDYSVENSANASTDFL